MESKCITPGQHWEIENWTVKRDQLNDMWTVSKFGQHVAGPFRTMAEVREWIAADLDSIDVGMQERTPAEREIQVALLEANDR